MTWLNTRRAFSLEQCPFFSSSFSSNFGVAFSSGSAFDSADALLGSSIPTTSGVVIICAPEALAALMRSLTEAIFSSGSGDKQTEILEGSILSLDLRGYLVEEKTQSEFEAAIAEFSGESTNETLVSDVVNAIEMAKNDESISFLLVEMDDFLDLIRRLREFL